MSYHPSFQTEYTHEELVEHFWLHSEEIEFVESFRSEVNKQTVAVLLKGLEYLGGFPESLEQIPEQVRIFPEYLSSNRRAANCRAKTTIG